MSPVQLPRPPVYVGSTPGHGGTRAGAGRPKGTSIASGRTRVYKRTAERAELLSLWRAEVSHQFKSLVRAQLSAAQGVTHMVARDDQGRWTTVTDPDVMVERLNAGEETYRLSAVAPNATLIGQIMDRLFGQARQTIDLDVSTEPSRLSDIELSASLSGLLQKLAPTDPPAELAAPSRDVSGLTTGAEIPTGADIPTTEQPRPVTEPDA